jgi:adenylate kinase
VTKDSDIGKQAKSYLDTGLLVPDELILEMMAGVLIKPDCAPGFILDGFPRTIPQAIGLEKLLTKIGKKLNVVVSIEVADEEIVRRLSARWICRNCGYIYNTLTDPPPTDNICRKCGKGEIYQRDDDKEETVRNRLRIYREKTAPLIAYYQKKGMLLPISGIGAAEDIFHRMKQALYDQGLQPQRD